MIDLLNNGDLRELIEHRAENSTSIYIPTHPVGEDMEQDPIRLKNALNHAEDRLASGGLRRAEAERLLQPAKLLLNERSFWRNQSTALGLFLSSELTRSYRLPIQVEEMIVISDRFHIKPLMPMLSGDGRFYVLAISQNDVRMLEGTRYTLSELDLENVPKSLGEALRFEDPEARLQFHTSTGASGGERGQAGPRRAMFHGQGAPEADRKDAILRYFHILDNGLGDLLHNHNTPLVLAGVDYLHPLYQQANSYPGLVEEGVHGNPENWSDKELHQRAWELVAPLMDRQRDKALDLYGDLSDTDRVSSKLDEVVPAAHYGRVDTLFVALGKQRWGHFDPDANDIELHVESKVGNEDLLDAAAVHTLLNGGTVYAVEPEQVPGGSLLAAIFRYPLEA
jgi:hypothetical protein